MGVFSEGWKKELQNDAFEDCLPRGSGEGGLDHNLAEWFGDDELLGDYGKKISID